MHTDPSRNDESAVRLSFFIKYKGKIDGYYLVNKLADMGVHVVPDSFWKRIRNTIKYIFGYGSKYGDFDEFIFKKEDANKLQSVVDYLKS